MIGGQSIEELDGTTSPDTEEAMGFGEMNMVEGQLTDEVKKALEKIDMATQIIVGSEDSRERMSAISGIRKELIAGKITAEKAIVEAEKLGRL